MKERKENKTKGTEYGYVFLFRMVILVKLMFVALVFFDRVCLRIFLFCCVLYSLVFFFVFVGGMLLMVRFRCLPLCVFLCDMLIRDICVSLLVFWYGVAFSFVSCDVW